ncbi:hypothetical protein RB623_17710 [Mesorhizobium sp. LHD-90]|uniref:hypothetical protein n=1 Tax=Mesorhizobium sp. LHD-90 TaxID=3071414 RepID=UPI0027DEB21D|nr:hypothetical protein [Mesorhizobium sp. LHD-90]MDQ6435896.1 hypothetical protein [Mesorhizobium sp. LHD-90]
MIALLFGALLSIAATSGSWAADGAVQLAVAFCKTRTAGDAEAVKPLLTRSLLAVIAEAEARNKIIAEATPDEKPPFGDGIPYQSFPDLPDNCQPGVPTERAGRTEIPVSYSFRQSPDASWTDTLILVSSGGEVRIDDVRFMGAPDGSAPHSLREILHGAFDQ